MGQKTLAIIALIMLFWGGYEVSTLAQGRDCVHQGRRYPDGTVIGDRQCKDGRWVRTK